MTLDHQLLELIRCPACLGTFEPPAEDGAVTGAASDGELVCSACGLHYPVRNGVPVLLVDEATRPQD